MRTNVVFSLVIAASAVIGCAPPSEPPAEEPEVVTVAVDGAAEEAAAELAEASTGRIPEPTDLVGPFLLEDLGGRGVVDMVQTTIVFDGEGRASGRGGCNRFTGGYTFEDGQLSFGPIAGTKMMCPEAVMDQEDRFLSALGAVERVAVDGPFLLVYFAGEEDPMRFTRMETEVID